MAILLPALCATSAAVSKRCHNFRNNSRCASIFFRADGNLLLMCCQAVPPVHGMAAQTNVLGLLAS